MSRGRGGKAVRGAAGVGIATLVVLLLSAAPASAAVDYTVTNTSDSGAGSLRQAILDANSATDFNNILFAIPGGGVHTITPTSAPLPSITAPVNIDGTTQPGYGSSPLIEVDGSSLSCVFCRGLELNVSAVVQGLDVTNWPLAGILVNGKKAAGSAIQDNYVGTDAAGTAAAGNDTGIYVLAAGNVTVQRNLISGNSGPGVFVNTKAKGVVIRANQIGTNWSGTTSIPNTGDGVYVSAAPGVIVGGSAPADGNLVSGNGGNGVLVLLAKGTQVSNNLIGTNAAGTIARPNGGNGIQVSTSTGVALIDNLVSGNTGWGIEASTVKKLLIAGDFVGLNDSGIGAIGNGGGGIGLYDAPGTQIFPSDTSPTFASGNAGDGIFVSDAPGTIMYFPVAGLDVTGSGALANSGDGLHIIGSAGKVTVYLGYFSGNSGDGINVEDAPGNKFLAATVGLDGSGFSAVPNGGAGIRLAAPANLIGGLSGEPTLVSGNTGPGIILEAPGGDRIVTTGVGFTFGGSVPNGADGILVVNSAKNVIGGKPLSDDTNVIVGNAGSGIHAGGPGSTGNLITGNLIGMTPTTLDGNTSDGVWLQGANGNLVTSNLIGDNGASGIEDSTNGTHNTFRGNEIVGNTGLGIDLGLIGITANDAGDADTGDNDLQNFPVLTGATASGGKLTITGTLNSTPNAKFVLEFFSNTACDASGNGEGENPLGTKVVKTDASGNVTFTAKVKGTSIANLTATATAANGSTSELSACFP